MIPLLSIVQQEFLRTIEEYGSDPYGLRIHIPEVEKWAKYLLQKYPEADAEVVLLAVWFHDIGHYPLPNDTDHAVRGEERAKKILEDHQYPVDKMEKVLHCVRSHRCKDVQPNSLEAKILACADSASHITDSMYFSMAKDDKKQLVPFRAYKKMENDFRDTGIFPEVQYELRELLEAWRTLLKAYEKISFE